MPGLRMGGEGAVSFHQTGMPPHLLRLFESRPPLPFMPFPKKRRPILPYSGVGEYVEYFESPGSVEEQEDCKGRIWINPELGLQCRVEEPTRVERFVSNIRKKGESNAAAIEEAGKAWDPHADPNVEGEALHTLFVANLSSDVSERKLRREFETYGPIKRIRVVHDKYSGKPKGYAFIEYEDKEDMKEAYKVADGTRIEGKRCVVDVERGRTVPNWKPKRLGGGKGGGIVHEATLPRDPQKQSIAKLVFRELDLDIKPPVPAKSKRRDEGAARWKRDRYDDDDARYDGGRYRREYRPRHRYYDDHRAPKRERMSYGDDPVGPPPHHAGTAEKEEGEHSPEEGELA